MEVRLFSAGAERLEGADDVAQMDAKELARYDLVVIDSGNPDGNSWAYASSPRQKLGTFLVNNI